MLVFTTMEIFFFSPKVVGTKFLLHFVTLCLLHFRQKSKQAKVQERTFYHATCNMVPCNMQHETVQHATGKKSKQTKVQERTFYHATCNMVPCNIITIMPWTWWDTSQFGIMSNIKM